MSDTQTVTAYRRSPVQRRSGPPAKRSERYANGPSPKVIAAIELMIFGNLDSPPLTRQQAAKAVGLADVTLRQALAHPLTVKHYNSQLEVLRTSERARNIHAAIGIRDDDALKGTAAGGKTRIEAARYIDGEKAGGVTVNVGVGVNVQPGYQIAIPSDYADAGRQMLKLAGSTRNVADMQADVPTDGQGTPE